MSKPDSGYFTNTSGAGRSLIAEVQAHGDKISPYDVIGIAKDKNGKIIWLEKGTLEGKPSGLKHILDAHSDDFHSKGIATADISDFVLTAVTKGNIIGYQGKGTGRPIYKVTYNGKEYKVAVTVGSNGYIVGANPRS